MYKDHSVRLYSDPPSSVILLIRRLTDMSGGIWPLELHLPIAEDTVVFGVSVRKAASAKAVFGPIKFIPIGQWGCGNEWGPKVDDAWQAKMRVTFEKEIQNYLDEFVIKNSGAGAIVVDSGK